MLLLRFAGLIFSVVTMVFGTSAVFAQAYPNKPIRIVTGEAGGGPDLVARLIAQGISGNLGEQMIVENRVGGVISGDTVAKASPDGYTLLVSSGIVWLLPFMQDVPFDPVKDFSPVSLAIRAPNVLVVHPAVAANSVKELIALAKAQPGKLNYASASTGSASHLAAELFKSMAGVNMVRIPYKGGAQALTDLLATQVQLMFATPTSVTSHIKSGKLRALAVGSAQPSALFPGLTTVAASGLPGYESGVITGIFAPAKTPGAVIKRLNQEIMRLFKTPEMKERLLNTGLEAVGSSPAEFEAVIKSDLRVWGKLIKAVGIRAD